jgi:hypothetical protein
MAQRKTSVTRVLAAALAASTLLPSTLAFAQGGPGYGPYHPTDASHRRGHVWREGYCGERDPRAPDIMTYDRKTGTEVLVGRGDGATGDVTGINRTTGSTYAVHGDLTGPETTEFCTANGETNSAYSVTGAGAGGVVVRGQDGATGRRFQVSQGPNGGPSFRSADPVSGRSVDVVTLPDGTPVIREFGPHALACTRARLGVGAHVNVNNLTVGGRSETVISLGDC